MARIDSLCIFSDAQAFTATGLGTSSYDCGNITPKRQLGEGEPMAVTFQIDVAAKTSGGTETYEFQVIQSASSALSTATVIADMQYAASGAIIATALVAGYTLTLPIPPGFPLQRFIGVNFVGANTPTITFTAWLGRLADAPVKPQTYAKAYTISG